MKGTAPATFDRSKDLYARIHDLRIREGDSSGAVAHSKFHGKEVSHTTTARVLLEAFDYPATLAELLASSRQWGTIGVGMIERTLSQLKEAGLLFPIAGVLDRPLIIISAPRAGSTLLYETLRRSTHLWNVGGESHFIIESFPSLDVRHRGFTSNRLEAVDATEKVSRALHAAFISYLQDSAGIKFLSIPIAERPEKLRLLEKTPRNALRVSFLDAVFPDARFVFLYREPRQSLNSIIEAWRAPGFWQFKQSVPYCELPGWDRDEWCMLLPPGWQTMRARSLEEIAAFQWRVTNAVALSDLTQLPRDRWTILDYDDFLDNPAGHTARLCDFADIPYDDGLAAVVERPLRPSSSTVTVPRRDKWKENAEAIERVLPLVTPVAERIRTLKEGANAA